MKSNIYNISSNLTEDEKEMKIIELKKKGLTVEKIAEVFLESGIIISKSSIARTIRNYNDRNPNDRIRAEVKSKKNNKKINRKSQIDNSSELIKQICQLRDEGKSIIEIREDIKKIGIEIDYRTIFDVLGESKNFDIGRVKQEIETTISSKSKNEEETLKTKYIKINTNMVDVFVNSGRNDLDKKKETSKKKEIKKKEISKKKVETKIETVPVLEIKEDLNEKPSDIELDRILEKDILLQGKTIFGWCTENRKGSYKELLESRIKKLEVIATYSKKIKGEFIEDEDFLEVLKMAENSKSSRPDKRYEKYLNEYIKMKIMENGAIDPIKTRIFKDNTYMMIYILSNINPRFNKEEFTNEPSYDEKVYKKYKKIYEDKVNQYITRLEKVEQHAKESKQNRFDDLEI